MALACGRRLNDDNTKRNVTSKYLPTPSSGKRLPPTTTNSTDDQDAFGSRSYGFKEPDGGSSRVPRSRPPPRNRLPASSSTRLVAKKIREPETEDYGQPPDDTPDDGHRLNEPEATDSMERLKEPDSLDGPEDDGPPDDFERVKKVKEVSIISLKPKERNKALDPVGDQQGHAARSVVRPMRDLSIIVRNRHHPILIARQVPVHWIPRHHHRHHHTPKKPLPPAMPKHKPCKPCDPKVHKKHHHKPPKKPKKKKPKKKDDCPPKKKPHHKNLIYYAPIPTAMNYYYGGAKVRPNLVVPNLNKNHYAVEEHPEHQDAEDDTEKPFHQEVEDDVEEHRLAEPFDDEDPADGKLESY